MVYPLYRSFTHMVPSAEQPGLPMTRGGGKLFDVKAWWDFLSAEGPAYGYCPNAEKTYLIAKESLVDEAKTMFAAVSG